MHYYSNSHQTDLCYGRPNATHRKLKNLDPTRPDPTQPMDNSAPALLVGYGQLYPTAPHVGGQRSSDEACCLSVGPMDYPRPGGRPEDNNLWPWPRAVMVLTW